MKSTKLSADGQKLVARLKKDFDIELSDDVVIRRTYAGYWQKSKGAWSWFFYSLSLGAIHNIGSQHSIRELLRCKTITLYQAHGDTTLLIENKDA